VRQIVRVVGRIVGFAVLAVLLALRIAVAAVLAVVTPIVMPILALLSGGGLLVAVGFACAGHWHRGRCGKRIVGVLHMQRHFCHSRLLGSAREPGFLRSSCRGCGPDQKDGAECLSPLLSVATRI
jgi:hypothetical protein